MEANVLTDTITAFYGGNPMGSEKAVAQGKKLLDFLVLSQKTYKFVALITLN